MKDKFGLPWTCTVAGLALCLFFPLFVTRGIGAFDFWWWMAVNTVVLLSLVAISDPLWRREIKNDIAARPVRKLLLALLSAAILYFVFYAGNFISRRILSFAGGGIDDVYAFKGGASVIRVSLLLALVIGPGEELFWRGFLQRRLQDRLGGWTGFFIATGLYTLIHVGSFNAMLILAALTAGIVWGWFYLRFRSILLNMVSHVVWDLAVFVFFPFS
ncbi:lysostaphin resistance A-like protein [Acidobacteriota bacterium]